MNPPRCRDEGYIRPLPAAPKARSATEAARAQPPRPDAPAHDAFTRLLRRIEPDPAALGEEARPSARRGDGAPVGDGATLDKPHAHRTRLLTRHRPGEHRAVVPGINLISPAWTDGDRAYPADYRPYPEATDGKTEDDHFRDPLAAAAARGFRPRCALFDSGYRGPAGPRAVRGRGRHVLARMTGHRRARRDRGARRRGDAPPIAAAGAVAYRPGFGLVEAFRVVATGGDAQRRATDASGMEELVRPADAERARAIAGHPRGLKQHRGAERSRVRPGRARRAHIGLAPRAFVRLERRRYRAGIGWFEAKARVIRDAVRRCLEEPLYRLPAPSTA